MSDELYYRGSSSYETAVKNRLNELERSGVKNTAAMLTGLQDMEYGIRGEIRESTCAIIASQSILAESFKDSFDSVNNTLNIGFEMIAAGMGQLADSINAMSEAICNKLDEIHDIVNNPLLTASRELFRRASANFEKGYFEEALEDCKAAVEKNKTDYISWYLLGQIYLFGAGKFSNVIDLHKAEDAFLNAAKYIDADLGKSKEADELGSQIYYHLGYTRLLLSNDLLVEEKTDESNKKLEEAQKASRNSSRLNDKNIKALYDNAKELHFLGKDKEAIEALKDAIRLEKNFALISANDKNFESIWPDIEKAVLELRDELVQKCPEKLNDLKNEFEIDDVSEIEHVIDSQKDKDFYTVAKFFETELPRRVLDIAFAKALYGLVKARICNVNEDVLTSIRVKENDYELPDELVLENFVSTKLSSSESFMNYSVGFDSILFNFDDRNTSSDVNDEDNFKFKYKEVNELAEKCEKILPKLKNLHNELFMTPTHEEILERVIELRTDEKLREIYPDDKERWRDAEKELSGRTKSFPEICNEFEKLYENEKSSAVLKTLDSIKKLPGSQEAKDEKEKEEIARNKKVFDKLGFSSDCNEEYQKRLKGTVEIPSGIKRIPEKIFLDCEGITKVIIPEGVEVIAEYAFFRCNNIKSIVLPSSLRFIGEAAFLLDSNREKVEIMGYSLNVPSSLESVTASGFYGVTKEKDNFWNMTNIKLIVPEGVKKLHSQAFTGCKWIGSVLLPSSLEVIEWEAFAGCENLKTINIPESVKEIQDHAFSGCRNLNEEAEARIEKFNSKALEDNGGCFVATSGVLSAIVTFFELLLVFKYHPIWAGILSLVSLFMTLFSCQKSRLNKVLGFAYFVIGVWLFSGAGFVDGSHKVLAVINILAAILHFFVNSWGRKKK